MPDSKSRINSFAFLLFCFTLSALSWSCASEQIRKNEEEIQRQQEEITRLRTEIEELKSAQQAEEQKRQNCNRAFRDFERAQATKDPEQAIALYRLGLKLCPDDDIARYELGILLSTAGRTKEAAEEFEA
ncbi:MAG: hypothetical protein ACREP8_06140, partial [Candidatus Binatia bacterium]